MKERMHFISDIDKKKAKFTITCVALIIALGTGFIGCSSSSNPIDNPNIGNTQTPETNDVSFSSEEPVTDSSAKNSTVSLTSVAPVFIKLGGIDWRILDVKDGNALVMSENILFKRAFHSEDMHITWEKCDLRKYLNGEFYDSTFSKEEKERIVETTVKTNNNPWHPTENQAFPWYSNPGGNDTKDKVFLLSIDEVLKFFGDSGEVERHPVGATFVSDQFDDERIAKMQNGEDWWWWLRSPGLFFSACGGNYNHAACIASFGALGIDGDIVNHEYGGVRPVMWVKMQEDQPTGQCSCY